MLVLGGEGERLSERRLVGFFVDTGTAAAVFLEGTSESESEDDDESDDEELELELELDEEEDEDDAISHRNTNAFA